MIVVLGGSNQDKLSSALEYLKSKKLYNDELGDLLIQDGNNVKDLQSDSLFKANVINHFHCFIKKFSVLFDDKCERESFVKKLIQENPSVVIIGDEIGSGIVPIDKNDRNFRENYGRIMCDLVQNADKVIRITCGICQELK